MALPNFNVKDLGATPHGKAPNIGKSWPRLELINLFCPAIHDIVALPPDWTQHVGDNLSKFVKLENGDSIVDGPDGVSPTITTIPPRSQSGNDDPAGHTEFLYLSEEARRKVFDYPGFPRPVNTPKIPKYEVREIPGTGRGVYATCDMYPGDLICAERPLIVKTSVTVPPNGFHVGNHHTKDEIQALKLHGAERTLEAIVHRLTPERKAKFMSLANSHKEDGSGPCMGIVRTNQLEIRMVEGELEPDPQQWLRFAAVGDVLSLTNHSCIPNIKNSFDVASFSLQICAWARIKKGDELVWSYIARAPTAEQRQKDLSPYGFICKCRICTDSKTDMLWTSFSTRSYMVAGGFTIRLLKEDLDDPFHKKLPAGREDRLKMYNTMIIQLESMQRESDSYGYTGELRLLCLLHELYKRVGNETKRQKYVNLVLRWSKCQDINCRPYL